MDDSGSEVVHIPYAMGLLPKVGATGAEKGAQGLRAPVQKGAPPHAGCLHALPML